MVMRYLTMCNPRIVIVVERETVQRMGSTVLVLNRKSCRMLKTGTELRRPVLLHSTYMTKLLICDTSERTNCSSEEHGCISDDRTLTKARDATARNRSRQTRAYAGQTGIAQHNSMSMTQLWNKWKTWNSCDLID
uniref:Secreted protein n=1 Tax=Heterorhabditis bacteriophora TaxID=37862 RepID=A0A1I7XCH4_HETBA